MSPTVSKERQLEICCTHSNMKTLLALLLLSSAALGQRNSRNLLHAIIPYVGTYWESYLAYPTRPDSCLNLSDYIDAYDDFGINILDAPEEVGIVKIAFADIQAGYNCFAHFGPQDVCEPYICGLHLYGIAGIHDSKLKKLQDDISELQSQNKIVLLSYGGEEYGNIESGVYARFLDATVLEMVSAIEKLGLDGIDIANYGGGGEDFWMHGDYQTGHQLYLIRQ